MLTEDQIRYLLELLSHQTVAEFDGYKVVRERGGYSDDPKVGSIQASLSIMLEAARR
jgi:hypothetical protein